MMQKLAATNTHRLSTIIIIELTLTAMTICGGESLPVSSLTFNPQLASEPHIRSAPLPLEIQKGLPLNLASEGPAIVDSGLRAVSLLVRHSLLACNITPAARLEGSTYLCNDYRHASLLTRQGTPAYPIGQQSTDQS